MNEPMEKPTGPRQLSSCPCKSRETYAACCESFHLGRAKPATAEQLMRSRYSAYFFRHSTLRRIALNLLKTETSKSKESIRGKRIYASLDPSYLEAIIGLRQM